MTARQRGWLAVIAIAVVVGFAWVLTTDTLDAQPRTQIVNARGEVLTRWVDERYGVVCYAARGGLSANTVALSCVRLP